MSDTMTWILFALIVLWIVTLVLMQLSHNRWTRRWHRLHVAMNNGAAVSLIKDFMLAYEDELPPDALGHLYASACRFLAALAASEEKPR